MASKVEADYQAKLKERIKERFPGAIVLKNDPSLNRGMPDLTVLYKDRWGVLETKREEKEAGKKKNQRYYVSLMNEMSFARFIYPENEEDVLNEMEQAFRVRRSTRVHGSK